MALMPRRIRHRNGESSDSDDNAKRQVSLEISVTDTGPGISQDAAEKIFDPFYSTKDHGMGMGLSIVRTIVEAHNGQIEVPQPERHERRSLPSQLPLA